MVAGLVINTQESNVDTTGCEHWNLELDINRWSTPGLGSNGGHEVYFRTNLAFCLARKSLHTPDNGLLLWFVLGTSEGLLDLSLGGVLRNRNLKNHVSGIQLVREIGNHLQVDGDPAQQGRRVS